MWAGKRFRSPACWKPVLNSLMFSPGKSENLYMYVHNSQCIYREVTDIGKIDETSYF